jgi:hypothetical protein
MSLIQPSSVWRVGPAYTLRSFPENVRTGGSGTADGSGLLCTP